MSNFVRSRQESGSYCGPAVLQMLLSNLRVNISQKAIADAYASDDVVMREGIPLVGLAKSLKKIASRFQVWQKYNATVEDIYTLLDRNLLVGFDWQGIFTEDEYGDEYWNYQSRLKQHWEKIRGIPQLKGDQGHYCIALEVNKKKGYLRFADPYGHYAGKDRFVALWELEERWWDDRIDLNKKTNKKSYVMEQRLIFVVTLKGDKRPEKVGMEKV